MKVRTFILGQVAISAMVSIASITAAAPASACTNNPMFPAGIAGNCPADLNDLPIGAEESAAKFNQQAIDAQNGIFPGQVPPPPAQLPPPPPPPRLPQTTVCLPIPFVPCFPVGG
jgi:hypothetical protein